MSAPVANLRPSAIEVIEWVSAPNTSRRPFLVFPEGERSQGVHVEAFGVLDAMAMAADIFPDGDPWCAESTLTPKATP